jgi:hypothetical protein
MGSRDLKDPIIWTHFLFILNSILWLLVKEPVAAFFVLCSNVLSTMYHIYSEQNKLWHTLDTACAVITLSVTLFIAAPHITLFGWVLLLSSLSTSLYFKNEARRSDYDSWHSGWHVGVFFGQALLALSIESSVI